MSIFDQRERLRRRIEKKIERSIARRKREVNISISYRSSSQLIGPSIDDTMTLWIRNVVRDVLIANCVEATIKVDDKTIGPTMLPAVTAYVVRLRFL